MMPDNAHTSIMFTRMCFEKSDIKKKIIIVMSKLLTNFFYPIRQTTSENKQREQRTNKFEIYI